jgi:hypothetical protein
MHRALRPDGTLFIEDPNILQKDASPHNIDLRAHLFYYSIHTLAATLSARFELVEFADRGNLRTIFGKRKAAVERQLPDQLATAESLARFKRKGWLEYFFAGVAFSSRSGAFGR